MTDWVTFDRRQTPLTYGYGTEDRTNFKPVVAELTTVESSPLPTRHPGLDPTRGWPGRRHWPTRQSLA